MAQISEVKAGDLITAELMNQVLDDIAKLQVRVDELALQVSTPILSIFRIDRTDGLQPIRVGCRVTVTGLNFTIPGSRNSVYVDTAPANPIDNASTPTQLVFDMPNPGIGQTGRQATLSVTNADGQKGLLQFQLEPALIIPTGNLIVRYTTPPANSTNTTLASGPSDFGFKLIADVDQNASVQLSATSSTAGWGVLLVDPQGKTDFSKPIPLSRATGTHFERDFIVRVAVPSAGSSVINVGATEVTVGTHVNPAPVQPLNLAIGQPVPVPENRVAVNFASTSDKVSFEGGTAVFTRNTLGRIDFNVFFNNLGTSGGVATIFTPTFDLKSNDASIWQKGVQTGVQITISGPGGNGNTGLRITPPDIASSAELLLTVSGQPTGGTPVNVTYRVPLRVD